MTLISARSRTLPGSCVRRFVLFPERRGEPPGRAGINPAPILDVMAERLTLGVSIAGNRTGQGRAVKTRRASAVPFVRAAATPSPDRGS